MNIWKEVLIFLFLWLVFLKVYVVSGDDNKDEFDWLFDSISMDLLEYEILSVILYFFLVLFLVRCNFLFLRFVIWNVLKNLLELF